MNSRSILRLAGPEDDIPLPDPPELPDLDFPDPDDLPLPELPPFEDPFFDAFRNRVSRNIAFNSDTREPRPPVANATVAVASIAKAVAMMVVAGCSPVAPSTTCNDRSMAVFFDKNLNVITHVNFGGPAAGRNFIATAAAPDSCGHLHFIGTTSDTTLPVVSPVQGSNHGSGEGFIATLNPSTGKLGFFSYLGGGSFDELIDIAVDRRGNRWVAGNTQSADFPVTRSGVQPDIAGRIDGFIVRIVP